MRKLLLPILFALHFPFSVSGQVPVNCFEIESILVDACGAPEGANEMVLFHVGSSALNTSNLNTQWPNGPWRGICQNATTTLKVAALNRMILGCGWFIEPTAGVLPPDSRVLFFTSVNYDTLSHDFSAVNDTFYVIFQCPGNVAGHFVNAAGVQTLRTLRMQFNPPIGCGDTVTYDAHLLVDTSGVPGNGPPVGARNGATVEFAWNGTASYVNEGCQPPYFPLNPNAGVPIVVCEGDNVNLTGTVSGGNYSYHWAGGLGSFNSTNILNPVYYPAPGDTGNFYLYLVESSSCDSVRDSILITVNPLPFVTLMPDSIICPGQIFGINAGSGGTSYLWSTGSVNQNIFINSAGTYTVTVTNSCGSAVDSIIIGMNTIPVVNAGNDITLCVGDSILLDAGPNGVNYLWSSGDTSQTLMVNGAGVYYVTGSNNCGTSTDSITVTASAIASVNAGADQNICPGDSVILNAGPGGTAYQWSTGDTTQTVSVNATGNYSVTVTNSCGAASDTVTVTLIPTPVVDLGNDITACPGTSVLLDAGAGAATYLWSNSDVTQTSLVNVAGTYSVIGSNFCGSDYDTVIVAFSASAVVNAGIDITLCQGSSFLLDAGSAGLISYLWSTGDTTATLQVNAAGIYTVIGTNSCASDTDTVQIFIYPTGSVFAGNDTMLCPGDTLFLGNSSSTTGTLNWTTQGNGFFTDPSLLNSTYISSGDAGSVNLILHLTDSCGSFSDTLTLSFIPDPTGSLTATDTICYGDSIFLTYTGNGTGITWSGGNGNFGDSSAFATGYLPGPGESGDILFYASYTGGCGIVVDSITAWSADSNAADFTWTPTTIYPGTNVNFNNLSPSTNISFTWNFGDSLGSILRFPDHSYFSPGTYMVTLHVMDAAGCTQDVSYPLVVIPTDTLIPNVFSPNGDEVNDVLLFKMPPLKSFDLKIYDRWGALIFYSNNINTSWNGKLNGNDCPEGVYFYEVTAVLLNNLGIIQKAGNATLIR